MHIVEIRRRGVELGNVMAQMRTWADHHRIDPSAFEVAFIAGGEVRFRLSFEVWNAASAFAGAFGGQVLVTADQIVAA